MSSSDVVMGTFGVVALAVAALLWLAGMLI